MDLRQTVPAPGDPLRAVGPRRTPPLGEGVEESFATRRGQRVLRELAEQVDRGAVLREVAVAARAQLHVLLEGATLVLRQGAVEVGGHQLDELLAGHVVTPLRAGLIAK